MAYYNDGNGNYVTAEEHFGYRFGHDWNNLIGGHEALDAWEEENGCDAAAMQADGVLELDYENGNWYIDPDADVWSYIKDEDEDEDDAEGNEGSDDNDDKENDMVRDYWSTIEDIASMLSEEGTTKAQVEAWAGYLWNIKAYYWELDNHIYCDGEDNTTIYSRNIKALEDIAKFMPDDAFGAVTGDSRRAEIAEKVKDIFTQLYGVYIMRMDTDMRGNTWGMDDDVQFYDDAMIWNGKEEDEDTFDPEQDVPGWDDEPGAMIIWAFNRYGVEVSRSADGKNWLDGHDVATTLLDRITMDRATTLDNDNDKVAELRILELLSDYEAALDGHGPDRHEMFSRWAAAIDSKVDYRQDWNGDWNEEAFGHLGNYEIMAFYIKHADKN